MRRCWLMAGLVLTAAAAIGTIAGCGFIAGAVERQEGKSVAAKYVGLDKKSLAIVVYADDATLSEYPTTREDVSVFVFKQFQLHMPEVRLVNYRDVIKWQGETLNWQALPEKDIGKHFGVDRVLYIEVSEYATREPGTLDLLRGRLRATAKVFEVDAPGTTAAWQELMAVAWPEFSPAPVTIGDDATVRRRVVELFSNRLVNCFYDHKEVEPSIREKTM